LKFGRSVLVEAIPTPRGSSPQPDQRLGAVGGVLGDEVRDVVAVRAM
jgi:hypothetical protein